MEVIKIGSLKNSNKAARKFIELMGQKTVFAFYGEMGAGKTTFIKVVCAELGVNENMTSPSFSLVNEYITSDNRFIYHIDCYRLKNIYEAYDIGTEEYLNSGNLCFVEWPEKIEGLLPPGTVKISVQVMPDKTREILFNN
jgi:tRNA threonylcarbamoyladenosine biosynthesis protein TsaE